MPASLLQLSALASGVLASPTIELKDGSRIQGEIQSIDNGVYTVLSPSIGTVRVAQSNIVRIPYSAEVLNVAGSSGKAPAHDDTLAPDIHQCKRAWRKIRLPCSRS